jgi:hypothetical protein
MHIFGDFCVCSDHVDCFYEGSLWVVRGEGGVGGFFRLWGFLKLLWFLDFQKIWQKSRIYE